MSLTPVSRLACLLLVFTSPAFADESSADAGTADEVRPESTQEGTIERARNDIQRDTQRLGKSAGVKPEVLEADGGYGSAGCGLGSVIIRPSQHFTQIFAATTNGMFGNQTFGITSGTSNCDGPPEPVQATARFVTANRTALAIAAARGRGEPIEALAAIASCRAPSELGPVLQRNFGQIFPTAITSDHEVAHALLAVMQRHSGKLGCAALRG